MGQNVYEEDVVLPSTTYVTGGITVTIKQAIAITKVTNVALRSATGGSTTNLTVAPVLGSESGQTFKLQAYEGGAAVSDPQAEIASASTLLEGLTLAVTYLGVP